MPEIALLMVVGSMVGSTVTFALMRRIQLATSPRLNARQFATLEITKAALRNYGLTALKPEHIAQAKQAAALIIEDAP
jgi:membrane protein YqaA with SNARE-associated domain